MEEKIFVIYVGIAGIRSIDIPDYIKNISNKITPTTFKGEIIIIPTHSLDTKIECINPEYITDVELIKEHTEMMKILEKTLQEQLELLKK
jgi:hypothetical protein